MIVLHPLIFAAIVVAAAGIGVAVGHHLSSR